MQQARPSHLIGALLIGFAATLWGLDGVVLTPRLANLDVSLVVFLLHAIPFMLMNTLLYREAVRIKTFSRQDLFFFALVALCGGVIGVLSIVKALFLVNFHQLSIVVLLQKLQPVFAIMLAGILLKERLEISFLFWAVLAILAGYCMTFGLALPNFNTGTDTFQAALYATLAAFAFGCATVLGKKTLQKYNFKTLTYYRFGFASFFMLLYLLLTGGLSSIPAITPTNWLVFFIIAMTTGSGAVFIYYYGLSRVSAVVSTLCELSFPISAVLFDYLFNGTLLSSLQMLSAGIMLFAIIMATLRKQVARSKSTDILARPHIIKHRNQS